MAEVWYCKKIREQEREIKNLREDKEKKDEEIKEFKEKVRELEDKLKQFAIRKSSKRPKFPDFSLSKQERLINHNKGKSTGRRLKTDKLKEVTKEKHIYPEGINKTKCCCINKRIVTRLIEGKKEVILYYIYKEKWGNKTGKIKSVFSKSEYGMEITVILAFLVYELHLSVENTRKILLFFCDLELSKSQINSLLEQISGKWEKEFNNISNLILLSLVVYIDETGWKIFDKNCYTWIFKSINHTLLLYGEKRNEEVLDKILPLDQFEGIGVTDCYRVYVKRFKKAQKCWAHFLRDAIKLMLLYPNNEKYKIFFQEALKIFHDSKKIKKDNTSQQQKEKSVLELTERIKTICNEVDTKLNKESSLDYRKYVNLHKRLINNLDDLFVFVTTAAEPTSNIAERGLRPTAIARNNYQTSKTKKGAKRRSIISSVLSSLKQNLHDFTLKTVTAEILKWESTGKSLFHMQLQTAQQSLSP